MRARSTRILPSLAQSYAIHMTASPDGRYLAYTLVTGGSQSTLPETDLLLLDLGLGQSSTLTSEPGFEGLATWLPAKWAP